MRQAAAHMPARRRSRLWLLGWLLSLLLLVSAVAALQTRAGIDAALRLLISLSGGSVQLGGWQGQWLNDVTLTDLRVQAGKTLLRVDRLRLRWSAAELLQRRLHVTSLQLGVLRLTTAGSDEPVTLPQSLNLPLQIQIDHIALDQLWLLPQALELNAIRGNLGLRDGRYQLALEQLYSPWGRVQGKASLDALAPFALKADIHADLGLQGRALQASLRAFGTLADIQLDLQGNTGEVMLAGDAQVHPFASDPVRLLPRARLRASGIDLAAWHEGAPKTDLLAQMDVAPMTGQLSVALALDNRLPGAWDRHRLPLVQATGEAYLARDQLRLKQLELQLPGGWLALRGSLSPKALNLHADIREVNVARLYSTLLATRLSGQLVLGGSLKQPTLRLAVKDPRMAASGELRLRSLKQGPQLHLQKLLLSAGAASAELNGLLDLAPRRAAQLAVNLRHFNPASFGAFPVADLNGQVNLTGRLGGPPDVWLRLALDHSSLKGQVVQASGQLRLVGESVSQADLHLALGTAQLSVRGALGRSGDQLQLQLDVPDFSRVLAEWQGRASAAVMLSGELRRPLVEGSLQIQQLHGPGQLQAELLQLQVNLPRLRDAPAQIELQGRDLGWGDVRVPQLSGRLNGSQSLHQLTADASAEYQGQKQQLSLAATGAWQGAEGWQGRLTRFSGRGLLDVLLREPASLQLASGQVHLGPAELLLAGGVLKLQQTDWGPQGAVLQGSLSEVQLLHFMQASGVSLPLHTDLRLSGDWRLTQAGGWQGQARLYRSDGDVQLERGDGSMLPLALRQLELNLLAQAGKFNLDAQLVSRDFGKASGQLHGWSGGGEVPRPLALAVVFDIPSLSWLGPMLGPQLSVAGMMNGRMAADGLPGHLRWSGEMRAEQLQLNNPDWGMSYKNGQLQATLDSAGIQIEKLQIQGGDGVLGAQGQLSFLQDVAAGQLRLTTDHFVAMNRPDMQLTLSGDANARLADGKLDVSGKLRADRGFFRFNGGGVPTLSDDVVIVGRQRKNNGHQQKLPLSLVLDLDLGKQLRFEGWGIRTGLTGTARVKSVRGQPLSVVGTVRSDGGRYTAYGQDLKITRGALAFQGPLENPGLDVVAVRENLAVEPGIHLTGTLQSPRLTLIADSDMSEQEKLSWLILGRPPAEGGQQKADADILIAAATALLSRDQSTSLQQQIAGRFGVDEIGLRSRSTTSVSEANGASSTATQQVVAIGKRLSDKAYLVYEQGVDAASAAVKLTYTISRQWSVVAKAGQESQIDLFWNIWFD